MIFLPLYAFIVWALAFVWRRRIAGFIVALGSALPVLVITLIIAASTEVTTPGAAGSPLFLTFVPLSYGLIVTSIATFIAMQPRVTAKDPCRKCGYDIVGLESGVCPECGVEINRSPGYSMTRARRAPARSTSVRPATSTAPTSATPTQSPQNDAP